MASQMAIYEEEQKAFTAMCERLAHDALAKAIFVVDKDGQLITSIGETQGIDTTGLASLAAGSTAATGGLAQMLGEEEFPVHFHEGKKNNLHISVIGDVLILLVIFDERSTLGLVRLRVKRAYGGMTEILDKVLSRSDEAKSQAQDIFGEITDDDIDSLFGDAF